MQSSGCVIVSSLIFHNQYNNSTVIIFDLRIASQEANNIDKDNIRLQSRILFKRSIKKPAVDLRKENIRMYSVEDDMTMMDEEDTTDKVSQKSKANHRPRTTQGSKHFGEQELVNWKKQFHFASFPLYDFGNWIPFVMARWPCLGTGCGLPQVVFKNSKGKILNKELILRCRSMTMMNLISCRNIYAVLWNFVSDCSV